jgi:hypothetical protein
MITIWQIRYDNGTPTLWVSSEDQALGVQKEAGDTASIAPVACEMTEAGVINMLNTTSRGLLAKPRSRVSPPLNHLQLTNVQPVSCGRRRSGLPPGRSRGEPSPGLSRLLPIPAAGCLLSTHRGRSAEMPMLPAKPTLSAGAD